MRRERIPPIQAPNFSSQLKDPILRNGSTTNTKEYQFWTSSHLMTTGARLVKTRGGHFNEGAMSLFSNVTASGVDSCDDKGASLIKTACLP